jgi:hypothetical protein
MRLDGIDTSNFECKFGFDWFKFIVDLINITAHFKSVALLELISWSRAAAHLAP